MSGGLTSLDIQVWDAIEDRGLVVIHGNPAHPLLVKDHPADDVGHVVTKLGDETGARVVGRIERPQRLVVALPNVFDGIELHAAHNVWPKLFVEVLDQHWPFYRLTLKCQSFSQK